MDLTFDLTRRRRNSPEDEGFEVVIIPHLKGLPQQIGWKFDARVRDLLKIPTRVVQLGHLVRNRPWPDASFTIKTALLLDFVAVGADPKKAQGKVNRKGPKDFEVQIRLNSSLPSGPFYVQVSLQPEVKGKILPANKITVQGVLHEEVEPFPSKALLGAVPLGQTTKETVHLFSRSGRAFKVKEWISLSKGAKVEPIQNIGKEQKDFQITQEVSEKGNQQGFILFKVEFEDSSILEIPFNIYYYGLSEI